MEIENIINSHPDVLEAADVNLSLSPNQVAKCIEEIGIGFMFAQNFHPGMKYVMPVRKRIADKTIFNLLGPLTNPAGANTNTTIARNGPTTQGPKISLINETFCVSLN